MILVLVALLIGLAIPIFLQAPPLPGVTAIYWAVACVAGLDTVCGGIRAGLEEKFRSDVFLTGFVSNIAIAFFLSWLGDQIGINLYLVAALVMGGRVFTNLSLIRRMLLTKWQDQQDRKRRQREADSQTQAAAGTPPTGI